MTYNEHKRNVVGTIVFFVLGLLIGGFAAMIAVWREWLQYKKSGVLESNDILRYVIVSSTGAVVQMIIVLIILIKLWLI